MNDDNSTPRREPQNGETDVLVFPAAPNGEPSGWEARRRLRAAGERKGWHFLAVPAGARGGVDAGQTPTLGRGDLGPLASHAPDPRGYDVLRDEEVHRELEGRRVRRLVLSGGHTNHEVASTARTALDGGYDVVVVAETTRPGETRTREGTCSPPQDVQGITLATLERLGATVTSVEGLLSGSNESVVPQYVTELYGDSVGEVDFVQCDPLPSPSLRRSAALVVVNVREEYPAPEFGDRSHNDAEALIERLVVAWREDGRAVVHTRHPSPLLDGCPPVLQGSTVTPHAGEFVVEAATPDAFFHTDLAARLDAAGVTQLVVVGLPAQGAVAGTARAALTRGYEVILVEDAVVGFDTTDAAGHEIAGTEAQWVECTSLAAMGASLTEASEVERFVESRT
jgi:nicotinamidase-related amidase